MAMKCIMAGLLIAGLASVLQAAPDLTKSITGTVSDGSGNSLPYRLFRPPGYDTPGAKLPLVLFLHGAGERGTNNTSQVNSHIDGLFNATQSASYASYLLAPQCPTDKQWVNLPWNTGAYTNATAPAQSIPMTLAIKLIDDIIATTNIDTDRVYVTGLSMGGYGTWDIMAKRPDLFAAAAPMSGGGNKDAAANIKDIPTWIFHGSADGTVPVSGSRDMNTALLAAGGSPLYTELAGQGHVIWAPIYNDITTSGQFYPWMFSQSTPEPGALMGLAGAAMLLARRPRRQ